MAKKEPLPRFGPGQWVTIRDTGEHVKVEAPWSSAADAYRVRSRKRGVLFLAEAALNEVAAHPEAHLGKHWSRCKAAGCGAPLTPDLPICARCHGPTCYCSRCQCARPAPSAPRTRARAALAKPAASKAAAGGR